jgi:hypothetical protein
MKEIFSIKQTKFLQSFFIQVSGIVALFYDKIDQGGYVTLSTIALGIYVAADVTAKKNADAQAK